MSANFKTNVVTANDLLEGDVVWLTADNGWTRHIRGAQIMQDKAQAQVRLEYAQSQLALIVEPYLAEIQNGENGPQPVHFREVFRTRGPSNYRHGKQEENCVHIY